MLWWDFAFPLFADLVADFVFTQNWVVRSASNVEQNIVSVKRSLHYVELNPEPLMRFLRQNPRIGHSLHLLSDL